MASMAVIIIRTENCLKTIFYNHVVDSLTSPINSIYNYYSDLCDQIFNAKVDQRMSDDINPDMI